MNKPKKLRSQDWFGSDDLHGFIHRGWLKNQGWPADLFEGKPVVGICNTWSELTPCNAHFRELAEAVKRGVWEAGGFPLEFPVMSIGEPLMRPTSMLFRNLVSMDVAESIRANPIDGVVLLMGCDKTTPALLMGAASCDVPTIGLSGGPMLSGKFQGRDLGSGTGGTAYGTVVLHVSPEAAIGGPLALVREGDIIALDTPKRAITLEVSDAELRHRRHQWNPSTPPARGYARLYVDHVLQSDQGADLDFLIGGGGAEVSRDAH